jgi:hypothetical protein
VLSPLSLAVAAQLAVHSLLRVSNATCGSLNQVQPVLMRLTMLMISRGVKEVGVKLSGLGSRSLGSYARSVTGTICLAPGRCNVHLSPDVYLCLSVEPTFG